MSKKFTVLLVSLAIIIFCPVGIFVFQKERENNQKIYDFGYEAGQVDIAPSACPYSGYSGWVRGSLNKQNTLNPNKE